MAGARETSCFGGATPTFRDRRKGSERLYFEAQISWQADMAVSDFKTGAENREFWTCGSFAGFVAGTALCEP